MIYTNYNNTRIALTLLLHVFLVDLVDLLIERGASIEAHNRNNQTPLDCALSQQVMIALNQKPNGITKYHRRLTRHIHLLSFHVDLRPATTV